jgi:hypothetical protein
VRDERHKCRAHTDSDECSPLPIQRFDLQVDNIPNWNSNALLQLIRFAGTRRKHAHRNQELIRVRLHQVTINATTGMRHIASQSFDQTSEAVRRQLHAHVMPDRRW